MLIVLSQIDFHSGLDQKNKRNLKVQSCKLYNNKYMIVSAQISLTEFFALTAILVKLLSRKVLSINIKYNRNC